MAKLILSGSSPYHQFFIPGTPTVVWIDLIPALIASVPGQNIALTATLFELFASAASIVACTVLLMRSRVGNSIYAICSLTLPLALINNIFILQLGEEQHWLLILCAPFLLLRWLRSSGETVSKPAAIASGIAAGIGFSLNVLFPLAWLALEVGLSIKDLKPINWKQPELYSCLGSLCVVPLYFLIDFAAGKVFLQKIFSLQALTYISDIDPGFIFMNCAPDHNAFLFFSIATFITALALRERVSLVAPFMYLSLTGLGIYIFSKQGFTGQLILHVGAAMLLAGAILAYAAEWFAEQSERYSTFAKRRLITALTLIPLCVCLYFWNNWAESKAAIFKAAYLPEKIETAQPLVSQVTQLSKKGDQILFINDTPEPGCVITLLTEREPTPPIVWYFPMRHLTEPGSNILGELYRVDTHTPVLNDLCLTIQKVLEDGNAQLIFIQDGRTAEFMLRFGVFSQALERRYEYKGYIDTPLPQQEPLYMAGSHNVFRLYVRRKR